MHTRMERPCRIARTEDGRWGWSCWCCPPPRYRTVSLADTWAMAFDDADVHIRHDHPVLQVAAPASCEVGGRSS